MKKLAIIGGRNFSNQETFFAEIDPIRHQISEIITGGATGADTMAIDYAKKNNIPYKNIRPDYTKYPPKFAPIQRNEQIILQSDQVIAFWDGKSRGTKSAIEFARKYNRKLKIVKFTPEQNINKVVRR